MEPTSSGISTSAPPSTYRLARVGIPSKKFSNDLFDGLADNNDNCNKNLSYIASPERVITNQKVLFYRRVEDSRSAPSSPKRVILAHPKTSVAAVDHYNNIENVVRQRCASVSFY